MESKTEWGIVHESKFEDRILLGIDTKKIKYFYRGRIFKYYEMNSFLRRKFENALFLSRPKDLLKFRYI